MTIDRRNFVLGSLAAGAAAACGSNKDRGATPVPTPGPACNAALGGKAQLTWVDADFLDRQGVEGWSDMPMWIDNKGEYAGFGTMQNTRAVKAGLVFRPIGDTARDTIAWLQSLPDDQRAKARSSGIKPDREAQVLAAWKARK